MFKETLTMPERTSVDKKEEEKDIGHESVANKLAKLDFDMVIEKYCDGDPESLQDRAEFMTMQNDIMKNVMKKYLDIDYEKFDSHDSKIMNDQDEFLDWWTKNISKEFTKRYLKDF